MQKNNRQRCSDAEAVLPDEFTFKIPAIDTSVTDVPRSSDNITLFSLLTPDNIASHTASHRFSSDTMLHY